MRKLLFSLVAVTTMLFLSGCSSMWHAKHTHPTAEVLPPPAQRYFIDPSVEMQNYKTYGFLEVTAVRYKDALPPKDTSDHGLFGLFHSKKKEKEKHATVHYTDELIWRVVQDEMQRKGYAQVQPADADLLVIYYGGPRPQTPPEGVRVQPSSFDEYFAQNELRPHTFFIDVIDTKQNKLVYRGWDNSTFTRHDPEPNAVVGAVKTSIGFFPSKL